MLAPSRPEDYLDSALTAFAAGADGRSMLDALPVPIYATDAEGEVTYWNHACVEFAGRQPELGKDRWCVTWQMYTTDGEALKPENGAMAQAIKQRRLVRDTVAIAERPDGSRVAFRPYPTPLFAEDGSLSGAVNMLVDISDEHSRELRAQADHCRRLADATFDAKTSRVLGDMAESFDRIARQLGD